VPVKILLADDSMTAQNMARKILSDAGYDVVTVSNGAAALKKIPEINPDLLILDIYMPGYSGFEVCERVKRSSERTLVLLSVGKLEPYKEEDALAVRADGVIVKPFEATELMTTVQAVLQSQPARPPAAPSAAQPAVEASLGSAASFELQPGGYEPPLMAKDADPQPQARGAGAAFPAAAGTQTSLERELPLEVSRLTEGLGSTLPPPMLEAPSPSAAPVIGAPLPKGFTPVVEAAAAKAASLGIPLPRPPVPKPAETHPAFATREVPGIEHLMPEQLHKRPEATVVDAPPADRGHEPVAVPAFPVPPEAPVVPTGIVAQPEPEPLQPPQPEPAPAVVKFPFPEVDVTPPAQCAASPTEAQPPSYPAGTRLDTPAGVSSRWRIEVRQTSPQPPASGQLSPSDDFSIELLPESELQRVAGATAATDSHSSPPLSTGVEPISVPDFDFPPGTPPASMPAELNPLDAALGSTEAIPAVPGGFSFSVPSMLEATAAMALPELHQAHAAASSAPASARAERRDAERGDRASLDSAVIAEAVQHAMERYKPLIVAEIARELSKLRES
jgi:CheY-like chemotaxis protein